ncbi:MAG: acyltransferase family protein [Methanocorpusculum sp.]|nr:acyltransferase family protein [Methanocorpusculum sp.]
MGKQSDRIKYWDIAKGISMLLVIIGHTQIPYTLTAIIFSFHMPLFFIVSAYFIHTINLKKNINSANKHLIIPFAAGTLVEMFCTCLSGDTFGSVISQIKTLFLDFCGGMCKASPLFPHFNGTWILWFLPCLAVSRIIFVSVFRLLQEKPWYYMAFASFLITGFGFLLSKWSYLPWCAEIACVSFLFLYFGYILAKKNIFARRKLSLILFGISLAFWGFCVAFLRTFIELAMHSYPYSFISILEGCAGTFCVVYVCKKFENLRVFSEPLAWIGANSLIILIFHNAEYRYMPWNTLLSTFTDKAYYWLILSCSKILLILTLTFLYSQIQKAILSHRRIR